MRADLVGRVVLQCPQCGTIECYRRRGIEPMPYCVSCSERYDDARGDVVVERVEVHPLGTKEELEHLRATEARLKDEVMLVGMTEGTGGDCETVATAAVRSYRRAVLGEEGKR